MIFSPVLCRKYPEAPYPNVRRRRFRTHTVQKFTLRQRVQLLKHLIEIEAALVHRNERNYLKNALDKRQMYENNHTEYRS